MPVSRTVTWYRCVPAPLGLLAPRAQDDLARLGELDRVVQQVQQDLPQPAARRRRAIVGRARADLARHLDALARRHRADQVDHGLDAVAQRRTGASSSSMLAGLDLREVQDVVDDREQRLAAVRDGGRVLLLLVVEVGLQRAARSSR